MLLPLKNAEMTAQTRIITAVRKSQTGDVVNLFCLIPKDASPIRIKRLENRTCMTVPMMMPMTMVGMFVMSVLLMSSPDV